VGVEIGTDLYTHWLNLYASLNKAIGKDRAFNWL
jgi:hypothetical protein